MPVFTATTVFTALVANGASVFTALGAVLFPSGFGSFLAKLGAQFAVSYLVQMLAGKQNRPAFGVSGKLQAGDTVPRQFPMGKAMTAGSLVYANEWGTAGKTPNAYFTQVIALSDLPVKGLLSVMVNGVYVTLDAAPHADLGFPVLEYRVGGVDYLHIKFYDGTQTTADAFMVSDVGDVDRPYEATRVGTGMAYAICHARLNSSLFNGFPQYRFLLDSVALYDPSKDTSVGGSGSQSWATPSTWGGDGDYLPAVQAYNILRGISYDGAWLYGFQGMSEYRVPAAHAIAQINACRATITEDDGPQPMWRAGGMLSVDAECGTALEQIMAACAGRIAESGGVYKLDVGGSYTAVGSITDGSFLATEVVQHVPFKGLADMINAVAASYPEPDEGFNMKAAPTLLSAAFETADGGRRLASSLALPNVPYAEQVQRLQKEALIEARQENSHTGTLGPEWQGIEPNDVILWTSAKYGYVAQPFRVAAVLDRPDAHVVVDLQELGAGSGVWTTAAEYTVQAKVPTVLRRPPAQSVPGFAVSAVTVSLAGASVPGIKIEWDADDTLDDVDGIRYAVRLTADGSRKTRGFIGNLDEEEFDVSDNLAPGTAYEVRARIIADRETTWTAWTGVTTGSLTVGSPIAEAAQDAVGAMVDASLVYVDATPLLTRAALTGDVTAAQGTNATTIAARAVTWAKVQAMATARFLGRVTGGSGDVEELTAAQVKTALAIASTDLTDTSNVARLSADQTFAGDVTLAGNVFYTATTATVISGAATLTVADFSTSLVRWTGGAAALTLPTGTTLDTLFVANNTAFDFSVINTGAGTATITANTGVTILGAAAILAGTSARWSIRRAAASTYIANRLA